MEPSNQERNSFEAACREGDTEKVKSLLDRFPSLVNTKDGLWGIPGNIHYFICFMEPIFTKCMELIAKPSLEGFTLFSEKKNYKKEARKEILRIKNRSLTYIH